MKVLIACEFSGVVRDAFIKKGHEAMSCDIVPTDKPGPHYLGDVRDILYPGRKADIINPHEWDLLIAHPPCTYLAVSDARWLYNKDKSRNEERWSKLEESLDFVKLLMEAPIPKICIENPVSMISSRIRKPDQIIQPLQFGHGSTKKTCLWLKGLPGLQPTNIVEPEKYISGSGREWDKWFFESSLISNLEERSKFRSTTFQGIADAMASQWS